MPALNVGASYLGIPSCAGARSPMWRNVTVTFRHMVTHIWSLVFCKLYLWKMTDFEQVVFLDTDAYVTTGMPSGAFTCHVMTQRGRPLRISRAGEWGVNPASETR